MKSRPIRVQCDRCWKLVYIYVHGPSKLQRIKLLQYHKLQALRQVAKRPGRGGIAKRGETSR